MNVEAYEAVEQLSSSTHVYIGRSGKQKESHPLSVSRSYSWGSVTYVPGLFHCCRISKAASRIEISILMQPQLGSPAAMHEPIVLVVFDHLSFSIT